MKIGIIGAMEIEVAELKQLMNNISTEKISGITYYKGQINEKDVVVAKSGVGKVNSAVCTQTMILKYSPDVIINTGVAGSLDTRLNIADLVISDYVIQHDMDTSALGDPFGYISGLNIIKIPSTKHIIDKIKTSAKAIEDTNVFVGTIASGDQFISTNEQKKFITTNFNALCAEMEGASIGHVCYMNNVDFCIVRAISDNANGDAHIDFSSFVQIAVKKTTQLILNFLNNL